MSSVDNERKFSFSDRRAALIIAHPGHELRVYNWLRLARPSVSVITDGSGHSGKSRLASTTEILTRTGAKPSSIYGHLTDAEIYSAIINREFDLFTGLVEELARSLVSERIDYVAGDAIEGYNPAHDLCRLLTNAAVQIAGRLTNRSILNFDFLLDGLPGDCPETMSANAIWLHLDEEELSQKLETARGYSELTADVNRTLERGGEEALRIECLRPASNRITCEGLIEQPPYYELYGEKQVASGHYRKVLRYREQVLPLAEELQEYVGSRGGGIANPDHQ